MSNKLIIIGASGHGKVVADIALKMDNWNEIVFLDDKSINQSPLELDVMGKVDDSLHYIDEYEFIVGIGDNKLRESIQSDLESKGARLATLVHPNAIIGFDVYIGNGSVIMAGAIINPSSNIGKGCIVNTSASIDHDNTLSNYVHISPGVHLAGNVKVGKSTWIGIGSVVSNNLYITTDCKIGAGAAVIKEINTPGTYVGVPARKV
ncbi:acetyltransferase [Halobacillus sp. GSS1]|uniref:acetyltransferase n=1 Tax=Halobacillus sp. GSS1 TaxID=2815919 RepID=UPI001A8E7ABE|nr:acetyltransferase [Halobacillus sp. GSS1]MBN9655057.1 acetyltransferase [Halobacillus sp. GSS1]